MLIRLLSRVRSITGHTKAASPNPYHAVIDSSNDTLIAIGAYPFALTLLSESMLDTTYVPGIAADVSEITSSPVRRYPEFSWSHGSRSFRKTNPAIVTDELRDRAEFAAKKAEVFMRALYIVNRMRDKATTGLHLQETVYMEKVRQARMLQEHGHDASIAEQIPYVVHYAEDTGITLRQACDEILFQARLDHDLLEKTERTRLSLFRRLKLAKTANELEKIMRTFYTNSL